MLTKDPKQTNYNPIIYLTLYPKLLEIAQECGYNLAVHGSMQRDFDMVAIPWVQNCTTSIVLISKLSQWLKGKIEAPDFAKEKPHGREPWVIHIEEGKYLDISVITPRPELYNENAIEVILTTQKYLYDNE